MAAEHQVLIALVVDDDDGYRRYRAGMTPILHRYGGRFAYDFVVDETLESPIDARFNRVFLMCFPDRATRERFFADADYRAVRAREFEPSVTETHVIAAFSELNG